MPEKASVLVDSLVEELASLAEKVERVRKDLVVVEVSPDKLARIASLLRDRGFDHVASVEGIDRPKEGVVEVVYQAESYDENLRGVIIELKTKVPRDKPELDTLIDVWPNAFYMERETWDLVGVVFRGHPELKRLLMPPDWEGHPLRKDFVVKEEGIFVELER